MKRFFTATLAGVLVTVAASAGLAEEKAEDKKDDQAAAVDVGAELATHEEVQSLSIEFEKLTSFCLNVDGNLLACDAGAGQIKVIDPNGRLTGTIPLEFGPQAIDTAADGTIYCGGEGKLAKLDPGGKLLRTVGVPEEAASDKVERRRSASNRRRISGIAVSDRDVFAAFGKGGGRGSKSKLYRFDLELENPTVLAEGLRACCQRCDITLRDGVLYLAENCVHRVVSYNRDGDVLGKWGEKSRTDLAGFGSCCNPMNLCFGPDGVLYTAESGVGRVKRYSTEGKLLGLVGYLGTTRFSKASSLAVSCSNIAIAVTPDGRRVYAMDYKENKIRVLQKKD